MWLYILGLMALGLLLIFFEVFVPGGVLGVIGLLVMTGGIWLSFSAYGVLEGFVVLITCVTLSILLIGIFIKRFPYTFIGKKAILSQQEDKCDGYHAESFHSDLLEKEGIAESDLRPAGIALIEGQRFDVVTEGEYIENHNRIKVKRINGNRIIVTQV